MRRRGGVETASGLTILMFHEVTPGSTNMLVSRYFCPRCGYEPPGKTPGYLYALDAAGARVVCLDALESTTVRRVTGMDYADALAAGRLGTVEFLVCIDCGAQSDLDPDRDPLRCTICGSGELRRLHELIGQACPKCHAGQIEIQHLGVS